MPRISYRNDIVKKLKSAADSSGEFQMLLKLAEQLADEQAGQADETADYPLHQEFRLALNRYFATHSDLADPSHAILRGLYRKVYNTCEEMQKKNKDNTKLFEATEKHYRKKAEAAKKRGDEAGMKAAAEAGNYVRSLQYEWQFVDTTKEELNPRPDTRNRERGENLYRGNLKHLIYRSLFTDDFSEAAGRLGAKEPEPGTRPSAERLDTVRRLKATKEKASDFASVDRSSLFTDIGFEPEKKQIPEERQALNYQDMIARLRDGKVGVSFGSKQYDYILRDLEQLMHREQMVRQAYGDLPTLDEYLRKEVLPLKRNLLAQMKYYIDRKRDERQASRSERPNSTRRRTLMEDLSRDLEQDIDNWDERHPETADDHVFSDIKNQLSIRGTDIKQPADYKQILDAVGEMKDDSIRILSGAEAKKQIEKESRLLKQMEQYLIKHMPQKRYEDADGKTFYDFSVSMFQDQQLKRVPKTNEEKLYKGMLLGYQKLCEHMLHMKSRHQPADYATSRFAMQHEGQNVKHKGVNEYFGISVDFDKAMKIPRSSSMKEYLKDLDDLQKKTAGTYLLDQYSRANASIPADPDEKEVQKELIERTAGQMVQIAIARKLAERWNERREQAGADADRFSFREMDDHRLEVLQHVADNTVVACIRDHFMEVCDINKADPSDHRSPEQKINDNYKNLQNPVWVDEQMKEGVLAYFQDAVTSMSVVANAMYHEDAFTFESLEGRASGWRDNVRKMPALLKTFGMDEKLLHEVKVSKSTYWVKKGTSLADAFTQLNTIMKGMHPKEERSPEEQKKLEEILKKNNNGVIPKNLDPGKKNEEEGIQNHI